MSKKRRPRLRKNLRSKGRRLELQVSGDLLRCLDADATQMGVSANEAGRRALRLFYGLAVAPEGDAAEEE